MKKKIIVLGGGISGCSVAYYLNQKGYDVTVIEKKRIGGLCATEEFGGVKYEFGPHICYASNNTPSFDLFHRLLPEFKDIKYFPKQSMDGEVDNLATFPITVSNVLNLPQEDIVNAIEELYNVNLEKPDYTNFESYIISRVGRTMYNYCYKNYNIKQWGLDPADMDSEWARFRNFYLRSGDYGMFGDKWQGHPTDYSPLFERLMQDVNIVYENIEDVVITNNRVSEIRTKCNSYSADIYVSTLPIDTVMGEKDALQYRGITKLYYLLKGKSGFPTYLCTFPNNYAWTRITDYVLQAEQESDNSLISFAIPHASTDEDLEITTWKKEAEDFISRKLKKEIIGDFYLDEKYVYPVSSEKMLKKYTELIKNASNIGNLITFGRLGLYSYISMCTAVDQAHDVSENIEELIKGNSEYKFDFYSGLRRVLS